MESYLLIVFISLNVFATFKMFNLFKVVNNNTFYKENSVAGKKCDALSESFLNRWPMYPMYQCYTCSAVLV